MVGSSILIIYDSQHVGAWVIDFAKTLPLPDGLAVTHRQPWQQGNHEEGWLTGIDNLIRVMKNELPRRISYYAVCKWEFASIIFGQFYNSAFYFYFFFFKSVVQDIEALYCDASNTKDVHLKR